MIVLDASAAIEIVRGTSFGLAFRTLALTGEKIIAPYLYCSEVANALRSYAQAGLMDATDALTKAAEACAIIDEFVSDESLLPEALGESLLRHHPTYDLFYLTLARRRNATLFTRDRKLQELCKLAGVDSIREIAV